MYEKTSNPYQFKYLITGITGPGIKEIYLPEWPEDSKFLFKKEQKFIKPVMSDQLKEWIDEADFEKNKKDKQGNYYNLEYVHQHQKEINEWEDMQWERGNEGLFFWNAGVRTYVTGDYYRYLTEWKPDFEVEYRETDKEFFYWVKFWEGDPEAYGGTYNTLRREGKSAKMGFWITNRTISNFKHFSGMQGEDDTKIKAFYELHILPPFYKLPSYRQPVYDTTSLQKKGIVFNEPPRRHRKKTTGRTVLESKMDYRTSEENKYDQAKLHSYAGEEFGKCHPAGTLVRMHDGSLKDVINVREGDELMGDDSNPRVVKKLGSGFGKIFKIIPNSKVDPWFVNEYHILSCKSSSLHHTGYKKGTTINLSVQEYLSLSPSVRKNLMCYRVGVDYKPRGHSIEPYLLGVWLGDGSSDHGEITSADQEIVTWLYNNWHSIHKKKKYKDRTPLYYLHGLRVILRQLGVLKNKHIPQEYMIDSRSNRLKLLAGLLDTDGHRNVRKGTRHYEIIQVRKDLAYQIKELALSLGFSATLNAKNCTMKREDGSIYETTGYRVSIFGYDLHEIPCQVERKKMPLNSSNYNVKDPRVYGFKVEYSHDDWYYGFNISGNRLYLLDNYTVTHNTLTANVWNRWGFVKPALTLGKKIIGKALIGTTVEFMDASGKGGRAYEKLCYASDYDKRNTNNQTKSGLYAALMPADCALEGFFDDNGHPLREQAREWILNAREDVEDNPADYATLVRKYPLDWDEVFYTSAEHCEFNIKILQDRKKELMRKPPPMRRFDLQWENNVRFSKIVMQDNPSGWFKTTKVFTGEEAERIYNQVSRRVENGEQRFAPLNDNLFASGLDPIDHGMVVSDSPMGEDGFTSSRKSKPVLLIKSKYDTAIDGMMDFELMKQRAKEKFPYKTGIHVAMMDERPGDPNVLFERVLMVLWLMGISVGVESQKPGVINWLRKAGCSDFIWHKYVPDEKKTRPGDMVEGTPASQPIIQEYTGLIATDVEYFGHTYPFIEVVNNDLRFRPDKTREFDYTVSQGNMEIAAQMRPRNQRPKPRQIEEYFRRFIRLPNGTMVQMK